MKCIKCGAGMDETKVGLDMSMWGPEQKRPGMAISQPNLSPYKAFVCKECGYTEFYAYKDK